MSRCLPIASFQLSSLEAVSCYCIGNGFTCNFLGKTLATWDYATKEQVCQTVGTAKKAQRDWAKRTWLERSDVLRKTAELLKVHCNDIAYWECVSNGKPITEAKADVLSCVDTFTFYSGVGKHFVQAWIQALFFKYRFSSEPPWPSRPAGPHSLCLYLPHSCRSGCCYWRMELSDSDVLLEDSSSTGLRKLCNLQAESSLARHCSDSCGNSEKSWIARWSVQRDSRRRGDCSKPHSA